MPLPSIIDVTRADLCTQREDLETKYANTQVEHIICPRDILQKYCRPHRQQYQSISYIRRGHETSETSKTHRVQK